MRIDALILSILTGATAASAFGQTAATSTASGATAGAAAATRATTQTMLQQQQALRQQQIQNVQQRALQNTVPTQQGTAGQTANANLGTPAAQGAQAAAPGGLLPNTPNTTAGQPAPASAVQGQPQIQGTTATTTVLPDGTVVNENGLANGSAASNLGNAANAANGLANFGTNTAAAPAAVLTPAGGIVQAAVPPVTNTTVVLQTNAPTRFVPVVVAERTAKPQLTLDELPSGPRRVINNELGDGTLYKLDKTSGTRGSGYRASFKRGDRYREIEVTEDGKIIRDTRESAGSIAATSYSTSRASQTFANLPVAVQTALLAHGTANEVQDISLTPSGERTAYAVRVNHRGRVSDLVIAKDGTMIRETDVDPTSAQAADATVAVGNAEPASLPVVVTDSQRDLPEPPPVVEAKPITIVKEAALETPAAPEPSVSQQNTATAPANDASGAAAETKPVTLEIADVPGPVRRAFEAEAGTATVKNITIGTKDGRVIYTGTYTKDGADKTATVAENGVVVQPK